MFTKKSFVISLVLVVGLLFAAAPTKPALAAGELTLNVGAGQAYATLEAAMAAVPADLDKVTYVLYDDQTFTTTGHGTPDLAMGADVVNLKKAPTVTGEVKLTLAGVYYGTLNAIGAEFNVEGLTLINGRDKSGEGTDPWEFAYFEPDSASVTFTDCKFNNGVMVSIDATFDNCLFSRQPLTFPPDTTDYSLNDYALWIHNFGDVVVKNSTFENFEYGGVKSTWNMYATGADLSLTLQDNTFVNIGNGGDHTIANLDGAVSVTITGNLVIDSYLGSTTDEQTALLEIDPITPTPTITVNSNIWATPSVVYVDDGWASVPIGDDPDDAGPAIAMGYDAFATVEGGVAAVGAGGLVNVYDGVYNPPATITLDKAISIIGPTTGEVKIIGAAGATNKIFNISTSDVTIQYLTFTLAVPPTAGDAMIYATEGTAVGEEPKTNINILDNEIYVEPQAGAMITWQAQAIYLGRLTTESKVNRNTIYNTRSGLVVAYQSALEIKDNVIYNTKGGIMNYTGTVADADARVMINNSWGTVHNEWDIVWNSGGGPYVMDMDKYVLQLSKAQSDARVVSLMTTGVLVELTGNRSHVFVNATTGTTTIKADNGNINVPYAKIQDGINAVVPGGTVYVAAGTYVEYVSINKDLSLIGDPGAIIQKPLIDVYYKIPDESGTRSYRPLIFAFGGDIISGDGTSAATAYVVQGVDTIDISISGFTIRGGNAWTSAISSAYADGILLRNVTGTVSSNVIEDMLPTDPTTGQYTLGIEVRGDNSVITISGNTVTEFGRSGILVAGKLGTPTATVTGNTVTAVYYGKYVTNGIEINYRSTGTVIGNIVTGASGVGTDWSGSGILIYDSDNVTVKQNQVSNCDVGIGIGARLNSGYKALNNSIENNVLDQNLLAAIEIATNSQNTIVKNNVITGVAARLDTAEAGIVVSEYKDPLSGYPDGVLIEGNTISGDPGFWGIDIYRNADNVTIQKNTITGGAVGVALDLKETNSIGKTVTISNAPGLGNKIVGQTDLQVSTGPYDYSGVIYQWIPDVPATYNYWGSACGPVAVSANVLYDPWYSNEAMTTTGSGTLGSFVFPTVGSTTESMNAIIACAAPGSTLTFEGGTYPGGLIVGPTKSELTFELNGATVGAGSPAFTISGDDITINGPGKLLGDSLSAGVVVNAGADNFILDGVEITGWTDGVYVGGAVESLKIVNNWIHTNSESALEVAGTPTGVVTIEGNLFKANTGVPVVYGGTGTLDATYNSWGAIGGPTGLGTNVAYDPFNYYEIYFDMDPTVTGEQTERQVFVGQTFTVDVKADAVNVSGVSFVFKYDETKLIYTPLVLPYVSPVGDCNPVPGLDTGEIGFFCAMTEGGEWDAVDGTIMTLTFTANGSDPDSFFDIYTDTTLSAGAIGGVKVWVNNAGYNDPSVTTRDLTDTNDGRLYIDQVANFTGFIDLEGRPNDSGALFEVYDLVSGGVLLTSATSESSGKYTTTLDPGLWMVDSVVNPASSVTYYVYVDRALFLPTFARWGVVLTDTPLTTLAQLKLLGGDATNDNLIDSADAGCIGGAYGTAGDVCVNGIDDVNEDGIVNIYDLTLMGGNYNLGVSSWTPQPLP